MFNWYVDGLGRYAVRPEGYRERAAYVAEHGYAVVLAAQAGAGRPIMNTMSAATSPPAFAWEEWHAAAGGRSIAIDQSATT